MDSKSSSKKSKLKIKLNKSEGKIYKDLFESYVVKNEATMHKKKIP